LPQGNLPISPDQVTVTGTRQAGGLIKVQEIVLGTDDEFLDPLEQARAGERVTPEQLSRPYPFKPQLGVPPPRGASPPPPPVWFQLLQLLEKLFGGGSNSAPPVLPDCPPGYLCT